MNSTRRDGFFRLVRKAPLTFGFLTISVALWVAVFLASLQAKSAFEASRTFGALHQLVRFERAVPALPDLARNTSDNGFEATELFGLLDLWSGQWWRIPVTAFHHQPVVPLHLIFNALAIGFLGSLVEPRMRRSSYFAFFVFAATFTMLSEALFEQGAVGLSGVAYALFGLVFVRRHYDEALAEAVPGSLIQFGFIWLIMCVPLTLLGIYPVANLAHFSGLFYGLLIGYVGWSTAAYWKSALVVTGHLAIIPAIWVAANPWWIGRYHWYMVTPATPVDQKVAYLKEAVRLDPSLAAPARQLANIYLDRGQTMTAWNTILRAVDSDRDDLESWSLAHQIWRHLESSDEQTRAIEILEGQFGNQAEAWQRRIAEGPPVELPVAPLVFPDMLDPPARQALGQGIVLPPMLDEPQENSGRPPRLTPPNIDAPDSASEGVTI